MFTETRQNELLSVNIRSVKPSGENISMFPLPKICNMQILRYFMSIGFIINHWWICSQTTVNLSSTTSQHFDSAWPDILHIF